MPLYLAFTPYVLGFIIFLYSLWQKTYLKFIYRYFLFSILIGFCCLTLTSILFLGMIYSAGQFNEIYLKAVLGGTIGLLALLFLPSWFVSKSFSKPISRIIDQTKSLKMGKLEHFRPDETSVEFNELIEGLNIMVRAID
ncbi:hypothetical protein ACFL27_18730, partial [candidate division CSSED10-310 bacterium]